MAVDISLAMIIVMTTDICRRPKIAIDNYRYLQIAADICIWWQLSADGVRYLQISKDSRPVSRKYNRIDSIIYTKGKFGKSKSTLFRTTSITLFQYVSVVMLADSLGGNRYCNL
jgi:hypothetical protein